MKHSLKHFFLSLFLLVATFFCFRVPFYGQGLVGEEGIFAYLFIHHVEKPNYLLISRIDGVELMGVPQHPAPMYAAINAAGALAGRVVDFSTLDAASSSALLRLLFSLPMLALGVAALCYVYRWRNANLYYWLALLVAFFASPVLLVTSTELQVDTSFGVLIFGVWTFAALAGLDSALSARVRRILLCLGGFLASLGKNEWSMVLAASLVAVTCYLAVRGRGTPSWRDDLKLVLCGCVGLVAGNFASYLFDPLNYRLGLELMLSMSRNQSVVNGSKLLQVLGTARQRWPYVGINLLLITTLFFLLLRPVQLARAAGKAFCLALPLAALAYLSSWSAFLPSHVMSFLLPIAVLCCSVAVWLAVLTPEIPSAPPDPPLLISAMFSVALFGAYFLSAWDGGPRYFSVALAVSLLVVLGLLKQRGELVEKKVLATLTVSILVLNGVSYVNRGTFCRVVPRTAGAAKISGGCLPVMSSGEAVFGSMDFLGGSCDQTYFETMSRRYRRPLCR